MNKPSLPIWKTLFLCFLIFGSIWTLNNHTREPDFQEEKGQIFGTTFHITYQSDRGLKDSILKELEQVDNSLSPFNKRSLLTAINENRTTQTDTLFREVYTMSQRISHETNGAFDCSVLPEGVIRILDFKTPSSGESGRMYLPNYRKLRKSDEVKFVIGDEADYHFSVEKIREFRMAEQTENLLFSPVYGTISLPFLAERMIADRVPARLNLQLHKIVWGPEREGV